MRVPLFFFWRQYGSQDWPDYPSRPSTWLVRIYAGRNPETGKRQYIGKSIQGGLSAAQAHLNRMLVERNLGRNIRSSRQTLDQYLDHWLEISAKLSRGDGPRASATTQVCSHGTFGRDWVQDRLEISRRRRSRRFTVNDSTGRCRRTRSVTPCGPRLGTAAGGAMEVAAAKPGRGCRSAPGAAATLHRFRCRAGEAVHRRYFGHKYEALFALAMTTGMRLSEYLALTWSDFNLERGTVSISKTLEWRKGGWRFKDTKRERSRRMVKLQNWVVALLRKFDEAASTAEAGLCDLVFTAERGGPIHEAKFVRRYFKPLLQSAGLPDIRLYDLRHTAATLGLVAGVSPKVLSEQLGHASVAFTLEVYLHVLPHMQDTAAMKIEALLRAA